MNGHESPDPWAQDDFLEDDFVDGVDDEGAELGVDYHTGAGAGARELGAIPQQSTIPHTQRRPSQVQYKVAPMSDKMVAGFPGVRSVLLTLDNGSQLLLVKRTKNG